MLLAAPLPLLAQTVDEQLLSAQMAYQQANNLQEQAAERLKQAQAAKQQADQRWQMPRRQYSVLRRNWLQLAVPTPQQSSRCNSRPSN
jgi:hypothetical protein